MFANRSMNNTSSSGGLFNFGQSGTQQQQQPQPQPQQVSTAQAGGNASVPSNSTLSSTNNVDITASLNIKSSDELLRELLDSASNLPKDSISKVNLGPIHLTLDELARKSEQLRKREDKANNFTKAHYLLAGSGLATGDIEEDLNKIQLPKSTTSSHYQQQQQRYFHRDDDSIEHYLKSNKEENILNTIEQSFALASKDFDNFISANISSDWQKRREELKQAVGLKDDIKFQEEAMKCSVVWKSKSAAANILTPLATKGNTSVRQTSREKFENYARVIYSLNEARLRDKAFPLCLNFYELNRLQDDLKSKQICEAWKILQGLTGEESATSSQEQKFFNFSKIELNDAISTSSRKFLEKEFYLYIEQLYAKSSHKSQTFLPATNINKISFFIHQIILKNDPELVNKTLLVNGTPIWALIYYLMRAGLYDEAAELVLRNRELFNKFDKNFPTYIRKYADSPRHTLPSELSERIHQEFNRQFQYVMNDLDSSINFDSYKYSVYKIVGKCDLHNKAVPQAINLSIEDWLWFHFAIINEYQQQQHPNDDEQSSIVFHNFGSSNLQSKIIQLESKFFLSSSSSKNPLYLKTLLLTGLYELAVQYCYEYVNETDAVHLAIGLTYFGLLKCSNFKKDDLLTVYGNEYEINYSRILGAYTTSFKISDPKVACEYLILIAMAQGGDSKEAVSVCHDALKELLLITREFGILIGELDPATTGVIEHGVMEKQRKLIKLEDIKAFNRQIVEATAVKCEDEGRIFDALLLYQLSCDYETTIVLVNKLLAELIATSDLNKPILYFGNCDVMSNGFTTSSSSSSSSSSGGGEEEKQGAGAAEETQETPENNIILLSEHIWNNFSKSSKILSSITPSVRHTCELLISIISIRDLFIKRNWQEVISRIDKLGLVPANAIDDLTKVRSYSELIENNDLDKNLIQVVPSLLILVMTCVSNINYDILTKKYQPISKGKGELDYWKKIARNYDQIVVIRNFFNKGFCDELIRLFETRVKLETTPKVKSKEYAARYNDRASLIDLDAADVLWRYMQRVLLTNEYSSEPQSEAIAKMFHDAIGLNPQLRIYRYLQGHHFGKHYDDSVVCDIPPLGKSKGITKWTLLIYLTGNDEFTGGGTIFYPEFGGKEMNIHPSKGMALLHKHGDACLQHEAEMVKRGVKWVLRSDVIFPA
ncbi:NIC96 [Candida oxycetoniae]|uniref:NIC96 n=1 Tax=Candida oxycetoniae TaxID=497107 RepID=A0AAI9WX62_9ASCO|nr:NIC96 [Candida oxycetoniae]KAI3403728.2 NIC96 [Candida oxycetoniae]